LAKNEDHVVQVPTVLQQYKKGSRPLVAGEPKCRSEKLYEALDFVAQGKVKTIVETYPLPEAPKAYDRVAQGKARFRAVLTT
jgi:propanol-preferring alcohol dehydrogenase